MELKNISGSTQKGYTQMILYIPAACRRDQAVSLSLVFSLDFFNANCLFFLLKDFRIFYN
ncbi:MAG: hypothetical protein D3913_16585 [Candidatus Electrothrix sp. LOE1_4_5]|nr:hypothetical protein [Candidatus Electrothrix gigas]